jgi:protein gp37
MLKRSRIGWADYSGGFLNSVLRGQAGDCEVSPECKNCYALTIIERFQMPVIHTAQDHVKLSRLAAWDIEAVRAQVSQGLDAPFRRGRTAKPLLFLCDMGDILHRNVDDEFFYRLLEIVAHKQEADFLLLTKRFRRLESIMKAFYGTVDPTPIPNLWLGVTAGTQYSWNTAIPYLMRTPAAIRFVSMEPMLEPIDIHPNNGPLPDWLILGGESGAGRREFKPEWAEDVYDQAKRSKHNVAVFAKQSGAFKPGQYLPIYGKPVKEFPQ